jgi:hypothetical protein
MVTKPAGLLMKTKPAGLLLMTNYYLWRQSLQGNLWRTHMDRVGQNHILNTYTVFHRMEHLKWLGLARTVYIDTVYDRIFDDVPAKNTVCTPCMYGPGQPYSWSNCGDKECRMQQPRDRHAKSKQSVNVVTPAYCTCWASYWFASHFMCWVLYCFANHFMCWILWHIADVTCYMLNERLWELAQLIIIIGKTIQEFVLFCWLYHVLSPTTHCWCDLLYA